MNVLGINCSLHDISVAYFRDGKLEFAIEEERLVKEKHKGGILLGGGMPKEALRIVLEKYGYRDIDYFCYAGDIFNQPVQYAENCNKIYMMAKQLDKKLDRTIFVDHHKCHALSSYAESGLERAGVLVVDGEGDACSVSIFYIDSNEIITKMKLPPTSSLGNLYSYVTDKIGFHSFGDEGKTMALASYGNILEGYDDIIKYSEDYFEIDWDLARNLLKNISIQSTFSEKADIARTIQKCIEEALVWLVNLTVKKTGCLDICISGGVAYNCKANAVLLKKSKAKNVFVPNMPGDSGLSIGAAVYAYYKLNKSNGFKNISPFVGTGYNNSDIEAYLKRNSIKYKYEKNYSEYAADLLKNGNNVLWFNGNLEFGPRALGNRSILGPIHLKGTADYINKYIKHRQLWRPFAPAIKAEMTKEYFDLDVHSPYMSFAPKVKERYKEVFGEVMSVDGCARIQTVDLNFNESFYKVIDCYGEMTGAYAILNTSFNDKGKPIVESLDDAVSFFFTSCIQYLFINGYLLEK